MKGILKILTSSLVTFLVYLLGGFDIALQSLLVFIVLDYITGIGKSYVSSSLNSKRGLKGIVKKLGILCMVAIATILDRIAGDSGLIRTMIIYYLVANEGLSIIENLGQMDIIVPEFIKDKLEQLKSNNGGDSHESK